MRAVPVLYSSDLTRSLAFYTGVLEFELRYPAYRELALRNGVLDLICDAAILQLSIHMGHHPTPSSVNLELEDPQEVDALFALYRARLRPVSPHGLARPPRANRSNLGDARVLCG